MEYSTENKSVMYKGENYGKRIETSTDNRGTVGKLL